MRRVSSWLARTVQQIAKHFLIITLFSRVCLENLERINVHKAWQLSQLDIARLCAAAKCIAACNIRCCSIREGKLPLIWKQTNVLAVLKVNPPTPYPVTPTSNFTGTSCKQNTRSIRWILYSGPDKYSAWVCCTWRWFCNCIYSHVDIHTCTYMIGTVCMVFSSLNKHKVVSDLFPPLK